MKDRVMRPSEVGGSKKNAKGEEKEEQKGVQKDEKNQ